MVVSTFGTNTISVEYDGVDNFISVNKSVIEYIDFAFIALGIDITYEKFQHMKDEDKKALLRDIKINKVIC